LSARGDQVFGLSEVGVEQGRHPEADRDLDRRAVELELEAIDRPAQRSAQRTALSSFDSRSSSENSSPP